MKITKSAVIGDRELSIETGRVAKQAGGSVLVQYGETVVLVAVATSAKPVEDKDFAPLMVDYREKFSAAGKVPGGFFKREGRPTEKETLSSRLIDRPVRALFNEDFKYETIINVTVMSSDKENDSDILGIIGASASLMVSDVPFEASIGAVRVGKINGELIVNPTFQQLPESKMDITVAGTKDSIVMVEGVSVEISEDELTEALEFAHENIKKMVTIIDELHKEAGKEKKPLSPKEIDPELDKRVRELAEPKIREAMNEKEKMPRYEKIDEGVAFVTEQLEEEFPEMEKEIYLVYKELQKEMIRDLIIKEKKRLDGRSYTDVRPISIELGVLPRTHGSALFTRGETQSLTVVTLGTKEDEQKIEGLEDSHYSNYILHYNFPAFSVGEARVPRGPGRREIGHGKLAWKALRYAIPSTEEFPYTIRIESDILESNGSSSMATVCAGSLAMMDAGVTIKKQSAGIAMGLIKEEDEFFVLSDILGDEDHLGDMDFKVAGSKDGFTAVQMDIKIKGISIEIMKKAIQQARDGIDHILGEMNKAIDTPRKELSKYAPSMMKFTVDVDNIGMVIGPGGKMIRELQEKTDTKIWIEDDGTVFIAGEGHGSAEKAKAMIDKMTEVPEVGKIYDGIVKKITDFGAFVEILPGKDGLLHISQISDQRIAKVTDKLKMGQEVRVKVKRIDPQGKVDLTAKHIN